MKKLIALALVLSLALVGVAQGASSSASKMREVERLCVWVEKTGTPDTRFDLKSVKAYTAVQKVCIVGKRGKSGKHGVRGKAGAKGATGLTGLQGLLGPQGLPGAIGPLGPTGPAGLDGLDGAEGGAGANGVNALDGADGADGAAGANGVDGLAGAKGEQGEQGPQGEQGEQGPAGPAGSNGTNGTNGVDGIDGEDGLNGSSIVTVAGDFIAGEKTFTVNCSPRLVLAQRWLRHPGQRDRVVPLGLNGRSGREHILDDHADLGQHRVWQGLRLLRSRKLDDQREDVRASPGTSATCGVARCPRPRSARSAARRSKSRALSNELSINHPSGPGPGPDVERRDHESAYHGPRRGEACRIGTRKRARQQRVHRRLPRLDAR